MYICMYIYIYKYVYICIWTFERDRAAETLAHTLVHLYRYVQYICMCIMCLSE
jgi:hypothetical protein